MKRIKKTKVQVIEILSAYYLAGPIKRKMVLLKAGISQATLYRLVNEYQIDTKKLYQEAKGAMCDAVADIIKLAEQNMIQSPELMNIDTDSEEYARIKAETQTELEEFKN